MSRTEQAENINLLKAMWPQFPFPFGPGPVQLWHLSLSRYLSLSLCIDPMSMTQRGYITLPIIVVLLVIGFVFYSTVFVVIESWMGLATAAGLANAAIFSLLAAMCVGTYVAAFRRDPGGVPSSYSPDIEDPEVSIHEVKRKVRFLPHFSSI